MFTGELIDRVIANTENLASTDADYAFRRVKVLEWAQDRFDETWNLKPWKWKQKSGTVTVPVSLNYGTVPVDFGNVSELGGVYVSEIEQREVQPQEIDRLQQLGDFGSSPTQFAVIGYDTTNQRSLMKFDSNGAFTATVLYERTCPLLSDRPIAPTLVEGAAGNPSGVYLYRVTFVTKDGLESEPGDTATITVVTKHVTVTVPISSAYNVASRKIYRTAASGTTYKLLTTISDDTTTTYDDNVADGSLGATLVETCSLMFIPPTYHFTVMLPGVIAKARKVKGDTRDWEADYQKGLAFMVNREIQRRSITKRLPRAVPGRMW